MLVYLFFPAKYRRAVFDPKVDMVLNEICLELAERYPLKYLEIGTDKAHVSIRWREFFTQWVKVSHFSFLKWAKIIAILGKKLRRFTSTRAVSR